ncbi:MAG: cytochrome c family protein, partial [Beijerinckiaceae bacterium]|nr:cytochrome c family protein [Beijerinckiaceae bacterium]
MDSFELNKIAGALLGTLLFVMGLGLLGDIIFNPHKAVVAGYELPVGEEAPKPGAAQAAAAPSVPLPQLLAKADAKKGEAQVKACAACH